MSDTKSTKSAAHNADCDAYEARIADLKARVLEAEADWRAEYRTREAVGDMLSAAEAKLDEWKRRCKAVLDEIGPFVHQSTLDNVLAILAPEKKT